MQHVGVCTWIVMALSNVFHVWSIWNNHFLVLDFFIQICFHAVGVTGILYSNTCKSCNSTQDKPVNISTEWKQIFQGLSTNTRSAFYWNTAMNRFSLMFGANRYALHVKIRREPGRCMRQSKSFFETAEHVHATGRWLRKNGPESRWQAWPPILRYVLLCVFCSCVCSFWAGKLMY